ncbi:acetyl hydrolase [Mycobacteriaceae bacterium 1482268.1]|nr:acetyl hydrolase [Mycobacteriaceae bacterium 1482268.1]
MAETSRAKRGSVQSRAAAALSTATLRPLTRVLPVERTWGLWLSRQILAGLMEACGPSLSGTEVEKVDTVLPDGRRLVGEWVRAQGVSHAASAIYYIHGSGYVLCSPRTHRRLTSWLSRLTGLPVFVVKYRLAPRYRFPKAADDVRAGWDWLTTEHGLPPDRMIIAGDSAGGHLAVDLVLHPDVAHPASLVLLSPLYDLTFGLARAREALRRDPVIRVRDAERLVGLYCAGTDLAHPRLTLDVAGGRPLPRTLIHAGGAEFLVADARALAADIRTAGGDCLLQVWPDQLHVFQALPRITPEAGPAMRSVARFVIESLGDTVVDLQAG